LAHQRDFKETDTAVIIRKKNSDAEFAFIFRVLGCEENQTNTEFAFS
jgi:adenylate cyclase class IV